MRFKSQPSIYCGYGILVKIGSVFYMAYLYGILEKSIFQQSFPVEKIFLNPNRPTLKASIRFWGSFEDFFTPFCPFW